MNPPSRLIELEVDGLQVANGGQESGLQLVSAKGRERISGGYAFDIDMRASQEVADDFAEKLGRPARLAISHGSRRRAWHGVIASVETHRLNVPPGAPDHTPHWVPLRVRLVPRCWLLKQRKGSRIYQQQSVVEIVTSVLASVGVPCRWALTHPPPARAFTTQYAETDWAFVHRLLAEAGIFYWFEQAPMDLKGGLDHALDELGGALPEEISSSPLGAAARSLLSPDAGIPTEGIVFADDATQYAVAGAPAMADWLLGLVSGVGALASAAGVPDEVQQIVTSVAGGISSASARHERAFRFVPEADAMGGDTADVIHAFAVGRALRPRRAVYREYDWRRPRAQIYARSGASVREGREWLERLPTDLGEIAKQIQEGPEKALGELREWGQQRLRGLFDPASEEQLEVYEHEPRHLFPDWEDARAEPDRMLSHARRRAHVAAGRSTTLRLAPGRRFTLEDHPTEALNGDYAVVEITHKAVLRGGEPVYGNELRCVPATVAFVPRRPARRVVQTCVTATVVGGDEIHTDDVGQIKVKFHWDREGRDDGESSCWIRVMQPWAGAGWGSQFIPRVGMEVVVGFDGGDPDRPIVLGSLYNATSKPPFALPENRTRSGIRTRSTPDGRGHGNELSFEDASGAEQLYIHAERALDVDVRQDRGSSVGRDDRIRIQRDRSVSVTCSHQERREWRLPVPPNCGFRR